ncbi:hypothetical protein MTR67_031786 [Solanum verrucosum]|uniref:RNase H family protein n=1 Tax=Solanum verrucosum TaxID=315347 RepID=A0AAF0ZEE1_SOLVR|nr:hypothetical protein MTR67_031786 [Solanum verrucosum]
MNVYLLATINPHKGIINKIHQMFAKFFWGKSGGVKGKHWVAWDDLFYPFKEGGVGFRSLHDVSKALFAKMWWNFRVTTNSYEELTYGINIVKKDHPVLAKGLGASHVWKMMIQVTEEVEHEILWQVRAETVAFGTELNGVHLQRLIISWWKPTGPVKIQKIFKIVPVVLMWELGKRRNARRRDREMNLYKLFQQCQNTINQFIKQTYPWIQCPVIWDEVVKLLKCYKPKLLHKVVTWNMPNTNWIKCNTDGLSKGNPGIGTYSFCVRDERSDLIFAEAQEIGITTNSMVEATVALRDFTICIFQSSNMLESQLTPLAIESMPISEDEIMQLLIDDKANSKSDYNDYKFDEQDDNVDEHPNKKICNHRHTKQHIDEMEA